MFHRVNRTSRYPSGWFGVVGQAPLPRRGIREGDPCWCDVASYLEKEKFEVGVASNGWMRYRWPGSSIPTSSFLDLALPGIDGCEVT
jgi:hypothetical protein